AQGQSLEEMLRNPYVNLLKVSPNYFDTLRIPLIRGRVFETTDTLKTAGVAVVNRRLAERLRPGGDVVGMRIKVGTPDETDDYMKWKQWLEIVGVVGDIKQDEVGGQSALALYMSYQQLMDGNMYVAVKCKVPPVTLVNPVNQAVWAIDPEQATFDIKPMDERLADMLRPQRLASSVVGLFAVVALVLAAGGLYGVMAYSVGQRTREIGIRLALGAQPLDVVHMILRETGQLILAGLLLGGMAVLVFGKMVATLLFEISPFDPLTFGVVSTILCCVMLLAGFIPARRAASTDPVQSMRVD
ncbi:MAG TPA: ABC transporter permease, partial [Acidobacteriota bacterium]|nr:ABC transporter permease [Acidobacteriota bacterium]